MEKRPEYQMEVKQIAGKQLDVEAGNFKFRESGYAEQVLRGLVHSGYEVTIREVFVELTPEELAGIRVSGLGSNRRSSTGDDCNQPTICESSG